MTRRNRGICPVCERYVGPVDVCPYCSVDGIVPSAISVLRWSSVIMAVAGLCFFWIMARHSDPPLVRACNISPIMRFARVRMAGSVEDSSSGVTGAGTSLRLSFKIDDGSGSIKVVADGFSAGRLIERYGTPGHGEFITVNGTLNTDRGGNWLLRATAWSRWPAPKQASMPEYIPHQDETYSSNHAVQGKDGQHE